MIICSGDNLGRIKAPFDVKIESTDLETLSQCTERLGVSLNNTLRGILQSEVLDGALITGVQLGVSAVRVSHRLGRKPLGFIVVKRDSGETVFEQPEDREDLFLNLQATGPVTVSLWVF